MLLCILILPTEALLFNLTEYFNLLDIKTILGYKLLDSVMNLNPLSWIKEQTLVLE